MSVAIAFETDPINRYSEGDNFNTTTFVFRDRAKRKKRVICS